MRLIFLVALVVLVLALPATAAKPVAATVSASPNPVVWGEWVTISGCGYPDARAYVEYADIGGSDFYAVDTSSGCFSTAFAASMQGHVEITVWDSVHNLNFTKKLAETTLEVT